MSPRRSGSTRDRVVAEAMRLFGEQGYAATTITQIEAASGLSRSFLARSSNSWNACRSRIRMRLKSRSFAHAGLRRLEHRQLEQALPIQGRDTCHSAHHQGLARWLATLADGAAGTSPAQDWEAVAAVVMDATAHYWLFQDIFRGNHPTGVSEERYLGAVVAGLLDRSVPTESG